MLGEQWRRALYFLKRDRSTLDLEEVTNSGQTRFDDTLTFLIVPLALLFPIALATLIPAYRELGVNPSEVMRAE